MSASDRLLDRAVRGGLWVFSLRITQQALIVLRLVILARLLSPNDFGLMGIALLTMAVIESLSQTGFDVALIQRKERIEDYLDTAWTVEILRGLTLFGILQVLASPAAKFFGSPDAEMLIRVVGLSLVFKGFLNIGTVFFRKELDSSSRGYRNVMKTYVCVVGFLLYGQLLGVWRTTNQTWHKYQQSTVRMVKSAAAYGQYLIQKLTSL